MSLAMQLIIGAFMIGLTVTCLAVALDIIIRHVDDFEKFIKKALKEHWKPIVTGSVVTAVFMAHILIIFMWAVLFKILDCAPLGDFSETLYFAMVVYSTLGFGDIILDESCRILSGIEGANGFILFGWTTAFIFEVFGQIYRKEVSEI